MRNHSIGFRLTLALIITALLTTGLSVYLFHILTEKAFADYLKENTLQVCRETSKIIEQVYDEGGWPRVQAFVQEISTPRGHQGMGSMMNLSRRNLILTDPQGNIMAFSRGMTVKSPVPRSLWKARVPIFSQGARVGYLLMVAPENSDKDSLEYVFTKTLSQYSFWAIILSLFIAIVTSFSISPKLVKPIKDLSHKVRRFSRGDRDISFSPGGRDEIGTLAEDFKVMADKIKKSEELRKNLTADVAHELRTPLSILRGTLESLQDDVLEPSNEVYLSMEDEVARMSRLVKDLADLSRAEAGKLELSLKEVPPTALRDKFSYFTAEASRRCLEFTIEIPDEIPPIPMDLLRISQVISNLLDNALRHTLKGRISLTARETLGGVEFSVEDTGTGVKAEDLPYIFERFYRQDKSRSRKTGGTGLGLSIAKGVVEAHGGKIKALSKEGQGTKVVFSLPG